MQRVSGLSLFVRPLLCNGLLTSEDEKSSPTAALGPAFVQRCIAGHAQLMAERAQRGVARMLAESDVELTQHTTQTTLEIVGKTLFDAELDERASEVGRYGRRPSATDRRRATWALRRYLRCLG